MLDPLEDREIKDIIPPPHRPLSDELLYPNKGNTLDRFIFNYFIGSNMPNWEILKTHMYREGRVTKEHCHKILKDTMNVFSNIHFIHIM